MRQNSVQKTQRKFFTSKLKRVAEIIKLLYGDKFEEYNILQTCRYKNSEFFEKVVIFGGIIGLYPSLQISLQKYVIWYSLVHEDQPF